MKHEAHNRMMLPVFGGICGSCRTTRNGGVCSLSSTSCVLSVQPTLGEVPVDDWSRSIDHSVSKRFEHCQQDSGNQDQDRKLVEPAIKDMTAGVSILLELAHHETTPQVVGDQDQD